MIGARFGGRRAVVLGGASFIGSHLVERLVAAGASVVVVDDLSSGRLDNLEACQGRIELHQADASLPGVAERACSGASAVFHLAARHGGRGYIDSHPVACATNVALDAVVLRAAAASGVDNVVFASSACAYPIDLHEGSGVDGALAERDAGFDVAGRAFADGEYGWAKLYTELQLAAFVKEQAFHATAARLFNAYGPREEESHALVALALRALAREDPFLIWGDGKQRRSFTHVDDIVTGLCLCATTTGFEVFNVGAAETVSIDELCEAIFAEVGWRPSTLHHDRSKPVGARVRVPDTAKLREAFGWEPSTALVDGLAQTVEWLRSR
ncbi:MAG: NAD-dependent epimerase/dehydratase family protein [Acidimicrobiales bacterium]